MKNCREKGRRGEKEVKEDTSRFERRRSKKGEEIKRGEEGTDGWRRGKRNGRRDDK